MQKIKIAHPEKDLANISVHVNERGKISNIKDLGKNFDKQSKVVLLASVQGEQQ